MTYGWAILIIVIVAAGLYSLGIFSPTNSASTSITGFNGLGSVQAACFPGGGLALQLGNSLGNIIEIKQINTTSQTGAKFSINFSTDIAPNSATNFVVSRGCTNSSGKYSNTVTVTYVEPGNTFPGPYFSTGTVSGNTITISHVGNFSGYSYINVSKLMMFAQSAATFSIWMKQPVSSFGELLIGSYNSPSAPDVWFRDNNNGSYDFTDWVYPVISSRGVWRHLVVTLNSTSVIFYINGIQVVKKGTIFNRHINILSIGGWNYAPPNQAFVGSLADAQVYNLSLTQSQIQSLYSEGIGGAPLSNAGLVGWWPLNGNANDYSGNNNNGVAINVTWVSP